MTRILGLVLAISMGAFSMGAAAEPKPKPAPKAKPAPSAAVLERNAARAAAFHACQTEIGLFCNKVKDKPDAALACVRRNHGDVWARCREKLDAYKPKR